MPSERAADYGLTRRRSAGVALGMFGVFAFSGTLPATKAAVPAFGPLVLTFARIEIAAALGGAYLVLTRPIHPPPARLLPGLLLTGLGLAVGFPLFVALAVAHVPASHGAVVVGLAPAATAVVAVVRTRERPPPTFWVGCIAGLAAVTAFAISQGGGSLQPADGWLAAAIASVALGYVEGGRLAQELGGPATLSWTMITLAPLVAIPLYVATDTHDWTGLSGPAWLGLAYVGIVSMFLGSLLWYEGLARGGIARISQLNLAQPLLAVAWSALLLGDHLGWSTPAAAAGVLFSMFICIKSRIPESAQTYD